MKQMIWMIALTFFWLSVSAEEKKSSKKKVVKYRKVQKIDFEGQDVSGVARSPMSSYLMQNKTMKFIPLYKVQKKNRESLVKSLQSLR